MSSQIALHGFLGEPSDWNFLSSISAYSIFQHPILPFWEWAESFNQKMALTPPPRTLIGYSLGGRLALHALIQAPSLWNKAVIISSNPGLEEMEREKRRINDQKWSERFLHEPWESLLDAWNQQPVFQGEKKFAREESHFSRNTLSKALIEWSIAKQDNLTHQLEELNIPILWITGEKDLKFCRISENISLQHPDSMKWKVNNAGHRVLLEKPEQLKKKIKTWI